MGRASEGCAHMYLLVPTRTVLHENEYQVPGTYLYLDRKAWREFRSWLLYSKRWLIVLPFVSNVLLCSHRISSQHTPSMLFGPSVLSAKCPFTFRYKQEQPNDTFHKSELARCEGTNVLSKQGHTFSPGWDNHNLKSISAVIPRRTKPRLHIFYTRSKDVHTVR